MSNIYIHIPFCKRICSYCDFPKRVSKTIEIDHYLDALEKEIKMYQIDTPVDTLYIGGGTPSILSLSQLSKLENILKSYYFSPDYEFTIECNPEHITLEKVKMFKKIGVNRVSLGVQTFHSKHLKLLNRAHQKEDVIKAVELLKNEGLTSISIDLIYAIPFQTLEDVINDLEVFKELKIPHVSYYSLILEEKTVFDKWLDEGKITLVENELEAKMYETIISSLKEIGYEHYEISNFAKKGFQSNHNKIYWTNNEYYGFGMGASGYLNHIRYYNEQLIKTYIEKIEKNGKPIVHEDTISKEEQLKEEFMLGLRLIDGINIQEVNQKYNINVLEYFSESFKYLLEKKWITINKNIKLTKIGLFYGNEVFELFI